MPPLPFSLRRLVVVSADGEARLEELVGARRRFETEVDEGDVRGESGEG